MTAADKATLLQVAKPIPREQEEFGGIANMVEPGVLHDIWSFAASVLLVIAVLEGSRSFPHPLLSDE